MLKNMHLGAPGRCVICSEPAGISPGFGLTALQGRTIGLPADRIGAYQLCDFHSDLCLGTRLTAHQIAFTDMGLLRDALTMAVENYDYATEEAKVEQELQAVAEKIAKAEKLRTLGQLSKARRHAAIALAEQLQLIGEQDSRIVPTLRLVAEIFENEPTDNALNALRMLLRRDPKDAESMFAMGRILFHRKDLAEADKWLKRALEQATPAMAMEIGEFQAMIALLSES